MGPQRSKLAKWLGLYQKPSNLDHLITQNDPQNTFRTKLGGVYSQLTTKKLGLTLSMGAMELNTHISTKITQNIR